MDRKNGLIAFVGPLQSGKTTCAFHLVKEYGYARHRFAGPLKNMLKAIGLTDAHVDGDLKHEPTDLLCGKTPRWAMQSIGTEWGRKLIGEDIWIRAWKNTLPTGAVVCDDLRFPNEAEAVKSMGGKIIRITRPGFEHNATHESEKHELPCDLELRNDGTLETLISRLDGLFASL